jgi:chemotaxis protein MotB
LGRKSKHEGEHENAERWLLTYADLITLLLAFFIVMYSMSKVDAKKFGAMSEALQTILKGKGASILSGEAMLKAEKGGGAMKIGDLKLLQNKIKKMAKDMGLEGKIDAEMDERGLVIRISESAFFDLGSADLKDQAIKVLDVIAGLLAEIPNHIQIEGHTDNLPIKTEKFPSNWELSVNRSTICVRYLIEKHNFPPERISALGYGEYRPIAGNNTGEGRSKNRRVDIVVLSWENKHNEPKANGEEFSHPTEENSSTVKTSSF